MALFIRSSRVAMIHMGGPGKRLSRFCWGSGGGSGLQVGISPSLLPVFSIVVSQCDALLPNVLVFRRYAVRNPIYYSVLMRSHPSLCNR